MRWPWHKKMATADDAVRDAEAALERAGEYSRKMVHLRRAVERIRAENNFTKDAREAITGISNSGNGGDQ